MTNKYHHCIYGPPHTNYLINFLSFQFNPHSSNNLTHPFHHSFQTINSLIFWKTYCGSWNCLKIYLPMCNWSILEGVKLNEDMILYFRVLKSRRYLMSFWNHMNKKWENFYSDTFCNSFNLNQFHNFNSQHQHIYKSPYFIHYHLTLINLSILFLVLAFISFIAKYKCIMCFVYLFNIPIEVFSSKTFISIHFNINSTQIKKCPITCLKISYAFLDELQIQIKTSIRPL